MRGSLSPSVLAKNKRIEVFRLVSARTDFSSEKSSCYRPTSEGICFAKQSEQWVSKPLLSQARLAEACPTYRDMLHQSVSYIITVLHYDDRAECKHAPQYRSIGLYCCRAGNFILHRLLFLFCKNQYSIQNPQ